MLPALRLGHRWHPVSAVTVGRATLYVTASGAVGMGAAAFRRRVAEGRARWS